MVSAIAHVNHTNMAWRHKTLLLESVKVTNKVNQSVKRHLLGACTSTIDTVCVTTDMLNISEHDVVSEVGCYEDF